MNLIPKMIGDVLRNLFRFPYTVPYPAKNVKPPDRYRGMIEIEDTCIACGACAAACPAKCIKFDRKSLVYWLPHCISCGRCADVCPVGAVTFTHNYEEAREDKELYAKKVYEMAKCSVCGKEFMPLVQKRYMVEVKKLKPELFEKCPACKLKPAPQQAQEQPRPEAPKEEPKEERGEKVEEIADGRKEEEKRPEHKAEQETDEPGEDETEDKVEGRSEEKEEGESDGTEQEEGPEAGEEDGAAEPIEQGGDAKEEPSHEDVFGGIEKMEFEDAPPWVRKSFED